MLGICDGPFLTIWHHYCYSPGLPGLSSEGGRGPPPPIRRVEREGRAGCWMMAFHVRVEGVTYVCYCCYCCSYYYYYHYYYYLLINCT